MKLYNFFRTLGWNISALFLVKGTWKTHINGDEFEKAILSHYGDYHLVAGITIVIEEGETACVGLNEKGGGPIERLVW